MAERLEELPVAAADLGGVAAALRDAGLPADDIAEPEVAVFEYRIDGRVVGYGGLEQHGPDVLLRSIVVFPNARGRGVGRQIVTSLLRRAERAGAREAFLLTTDARMWFERLGFAVLDRAQAPEGIRATRQMAALCPSTATFLFRGVEDGGDPAHLAVPHDA